MNAYARPARLEQALSVLTEGGWRVLAGGTDLYPGAGAQLAGKVLDVTAVEGLSGISRADGLRIGACTRWSDIASAVLPPAMQALQQAARQVGGRQIQNAGTIGGNLCNASPAADGVPPLLALEAEVELAGPSGLRRLPLRDFLLGPRRTARREDELLTAVLIPETALAGTSAFVKLGARAYLVISIAMVAARVVVDQGRIVDLAIAVGACSATARRLPRVEAALRGLPSDLASCRIEAGSVIADLAPISDMRATAEYRADAAVELVRRAVAGVLA